MNKRLKLLIVGLLILMAFVGITSAWSSVEVVLGNPKCTDINYIKFLKIDPDEGFDVPPWDGTFCDPDDNTKCVTIDAYCDYDGTEDCVEDDTKNNNQNIFDWTSTFPVSEVFVKGGPNANLYHYDNPEMSDTGLSPPLNIKENKPSPYYPYSLSHIDFCYVTPEFPTIALPVGMMIGIVGLVYIVKKREN